MFEWRHYSDIAKMALGRITVEVPTMSCRGRCIAGATCDVGAVTEALHAGGALALWDYAAAAPHVAIGMGNSASTSERIIVPVAVQVEVSRCLPMY